MSAMLHLAHGSVRMGQYGRRLITDASVDIRGLVPGKYIIHGRLGASGGVDPFPVIVDSPIELYARWSPSTGYTMLIDLDQFRPEGDYMGSPDMLIATGSTLRRIEVTMMIHTIAGDARYWGDDAAVQMANYSKGGLYKWESYLQVVPDNNGVNSAGKVNKRWTHWTGITPNVANARSLQVQQQSNLYVVDLSLSNSWHINNYNPTTPIHIENARRAGGAGVYNQIPNYDGVVTITLNSIDSTGVPSFTVGEASSVTGTPGDSTAPSWINSYTATSGKKGRIIIDYSGRLITAMGIDLPGDVKTW